MEDEIGKLCRKFNEKINYRGVVFPRFNAAQGHSSFRRREEYSFMQTSTEHFGSIGNEETDLYNGFNLNISELEACPEQLHLVMGSFVKEKLFHSYEGITSAKSDFPYKYCYPIFTTVTPDNEDYEMLILEMEKVIIQNFTDDKANPFLNTLNVIIVGPEVISIEVRGKQNSAGYSFALLIYGYD